MKPLLLALLACTLFAQDAPKQDIPHVSADAGACFVNFTVTDAGGKPFYNAKITGQVRYGFGSLHRVDLEVGTNSDGKARIDGLPDKTKKPIQFTIAHGDMSTTLDYNPGTNCHQDSDVKLGK